MSGGIVVCPSPIANNPKPSTSEQWTAYTLYYDGGNDNLQPSRHNLYGKNSRDALATHSHRSDFDSEIASSRNESYNHTQSSNLNKARPQLSAVSESSQDSVEVTQKSYSVQIQRPEHKHLLVKKNKQPVKPVPQKSSTETLAPGYYHNLTTGQELYIISGRQYRTKPCPPPLPETQPVERKQSEEYGSPSESVPISRASISSAIYDAKPTSRPRSIRTTKTDTNARMETQPSIKSQVIRSISQQQSELQTVQKHFEGANKPSGKNLSSMSAHVTVNQAPPSGRRVFLVRSGERMDRIFGSKWLITSFTDTGSYLPYDMNQPLVLPERPGGPSDYFNDSPITEMGNICGQMLGRGLRLQGVRPELVICSPALRAVQTASSIVKAYDPEGTLGIKICVEPGFFDFLEWYHEVPELMTPQQLTEVGYPIDLNYNAVLPSSHLHKWKSEQICHLYDRQRVVLANVLHRHPNIRDIIIIGHGVTMDACGRQMVHGDSTYPHPTKLDQLGVEYPYTSVLGAEELHDGHWRTLERGAPRISYLDYDNRINPEFFNRNPESS